MIWMWLLQPANGLINQVLANVWEPIVRAFGHAVQVVTFGHAGEGWVEWMAQPRWLGDPNGPHAQFVSREADRLPVEPRVAVHRDGGVVVRTGLEHGHLSGRPPGDSRSSVRERRSRRRRTVGAIQAHHVAAPEAHNLFIFVTAVIGASQVFGTVYVMTNGGPNNTTTTIVHQIFQNAFAFLKMGYASAMAFVLFLIIFVISMINWTFLKGDVEYS